MITISHTHADGTLVDGTSRGDGTAEILRANRFRWFPSIKLWGIAQSRDHLAKRWQINAAADALRAAGHEVTVEIDDTPRDVTEVKADRAGRLDMRAERLAAKAERQATEAERRFAAADHYSERFAGGQPILVGHHSERGARTAQKRIDQNMRAGVAAVRKAEHAARAAEAVGKADAYRERPPVIIRRIAKTEAELRQTQHYIDGTRPANDWRGAYSMDRTPASGAYLESLNARKAFLEHQLEADKAALAEHEANGYLRLGRDKIHKGDVVSWRRVIGGLPAETATVTRVNPRTVTLDRRSWPRTLPYEQITHVECPHEGTAVTVTLPRKPASEPRPAPAVVIPEQPAPPPEPIRVDARFEFFPTPAAIVAELIAHADLRPGLDVLEPSAGAGAIASAVAALGCKVDCVELVSDLCGVLECEDAGSPVYRHVRRGDFLEVQPGSVNPAFTREFYDRVIMNPPFKDRADVRHVLHAEKFLRPGGRLVAVMSAGASFREDKLTTEFRELVAARRGSITPLPEDAFRQAGTLVRTVLVVLPAAAAITEDRPDPAAELVLF